VTWRTRQPGQATQPTSMEQSDHHMRCSRAGNPPRPRPRLLRRDTLSETKTAAVAVQVETLAQALGDPPAITDPIIIQARRDHLSALSWGAADAAVELVLAYHRGEPLVVASPLVQGFITALLQLDRGWRCYVRDLDDEAEPIVLAALTFWAGTMIAVYVQASLEQIREHERAVMRELYPDA
jgi:hypothetical protein